LYIIIARRKQLPSSLSFFSFVHFVSYSSHTMAYQPIKEDLGFDGDIDVPESVWRKASSSSRLSTASKISITFAVVVLIILASLSLATLQATLHEQQVLNGQHETDAATTTPTTYSDDPRLMTLNTQDDYLWDEWTDDAQIVVPGKLPGEGLLEGAYSM
jgi:hypothetical protein